MRVLDKRRSPLSPDSLAGRFVMVIVLAELVFGVLLGLTVSAYSIQGAAEDRRSSIQYATGVVAASLLPGVADQDPAQIEAQLAHIVGMSDVYDIECVEISDATGAVLAESDPECTCDDVEPGSGLLSLFTDPQVVEQPIVVGEDVIAVASVQFRPVGLEQTLFAPLRATGLIVLMTVVLSSLWGTWLMMRTVVEPMEDLRDGAADIAKGVRGQQLSTPRKDEIGQLAKALDDMSQQLEEKEAHLLDSYHNLEDALISQERLGRELQRNIKVRSDFVAIASHELRSPLAIIQLYAEMMEVGEYGELDESLQGAVRSVVSAAARLGTIMTNLMDVALLERGIMPLESGEVDLGTLIRDSVSDASTVGSRGDVEVTLAGDVPEMTLKGDGVRLRQVMDNLLSNAVKFSDQHGSVTVDVGLDGSSVEVRVSDRGRGIPPDRMDVLFEPFGRVDSGDDAKVAGLGLGLAISARIATAHGGTLHVDRDAQGPGATFVFRLPLDGPDLDGRGIRVVEE